MQARNHLLGIQRAMYQRLRASASDYFGRHSPELDRYFQEYRRDFQRFGAISSKRELVSRLIQSQIALCGDYHTLPQAQRTALDYLSQILPEMRRAGRPVILGLEMLPFAHTAEADRYLSGDLEEKGFLKAIGFRESWGFDWKNYRELFAFARGNGLRIVGLNGPSTKGNSSLRVRDRFAARVLADLAKGNEQNFIFALVGDLHLAQKHLPADLSRALAWKQIRRDVVVLHQNQEDLYWKLAARGLEESTDVVKVRNGVYCAMNTPPWVKLQSLVRWSEMAGGDLDVGEDVIEVMEVLQNFLGMEEPVDPDFRVCGPKEIGWLARRRASDEGRKVRLEAIGRFGGHFVPGDNLIFLSDYGLPAIAGQAAILLHNQLSGFGREFRNPKRDFFPFVWVEALAFLGTKVIFPRRSPSVRRPKLPRLPASCRSPRAVLSYYERAKEAGAALGNLLFQAVLVGRLSRDSLRSLFENPFHDSAEARTLYLQWIGRLDKRRA